MKWINRMVFKEKKKDISLALALLWFWGLLAGPALAAPTGGVVTSGTAAISQAGNTTNINQSTNKASINWQTFSIKPAETVNFNQPSVYAITLNRVVGNESSIIQGALNATGRVFLINSNGVLFTKGSSVNTSGFLASTLNITDANFNAGNYVFNANGSLGSVVNQGTITANNGGYVALLGNTVSNQGVIAATRGTVALASGDQITLNFNGNSLLNVTVDQGTLNALVENKQAIYADGGTIILTAKAADDLLSAQVNNSGLIQARTIDDLKGNIQLLAQNGTVNVAGTLDASAPNGGDGGFIETSGNKVSIADSAVITTAAPYGKAGTWVIDPDGFTIGINSGDGDMTATALSNALISGNVTIASTSGSGTDGNINVNGPVSWSANTLTLNATNNIYVNNTMTATGAASFAANYGYLLNNGVPTTTPSGTGNADGTPYGLYTLQSAAFGSFSGKVGFSGTGTVTMNGTPYTVINTGVTTTTSGVTTYGLDYAAGNLSGNYVLGSDITWSAGSWGGIIGATSPFTGTFNGFGHVINSFSPTTFTGLFGTIGVGGMVSNLGFPSPSTPSSAPYAAAAGMLANYNQGNVINTFIAPGSWSSSANVGILGGLVGDNSGLIAQSGFWGNLYATNIAGCLVGLNEATGKILDSFTQSSATRVNSLAASTGVTYVGGLAGVNNGTIERSFTSGPLSLSDPNSLAGVFVGKNTGTIDQCYAGTDNSGYTFSKGQHIAGFVYENDGTITNSYTISLSNASSSMMWNAGFVYLNTGTIRNAYTETYSGNTLNAARYGFAYSNTGTITNAYWYSNALTGMTVPTDSSTATNLTTTQAATSYLSYAGFDPSIWGTSYSGYPILRNAPVFISSTSTLTYGSITADPTTLGSSTIGLQGFDDIDGMTTTSPYITLATDRGYVDAGAWTASKLVVSNYNNVKGLVTVSPKALTVSGVVADKTYDGTTTGTFNTGVANSGLAGLVEYQTLNVNYTSATFSDKNAATGKTVTIAYTAADGTNGGKANNYTIATTTTGNIIPKTISAAATGNDKVYDAATTATVSCALNGVVAGDSLSATYASAAFADANAGTNKLVNVYGVGLSGTSAGNYSLSTTSLTTTANITPRPVSLTGAKQADGNTSMPASGLTVMNAAGGDSVSVNGTATLGSSASGVQPITNLTSLTLNNPNYTMVGSVGTVVVGTGNLVLDHVVSGGTATINTVGNTTTINTSDRVVIDWLRFNIAANETVNFVQPAVTSIVLNRVTGSEPSVIAGALNANGRVFIINSNGILFAAGSSVNVGALLASTLGITDTNFQSSNYVFTAGASKNSVIAAGDIVIVSGEFLAMASNNGVTYSGSSIVPGGRILLASVDGLGLTLDTTGTGLNAYLATAPDGAVNLNGHMNVGSTTGNGGLVDTIGYWDNLGSNFVLNTGTNGSFSLAQWAPITIGTGGAITSDFVNNYLGVRNLSLTTMNGDLTVNSPVTWSADTTLTLSAANNININNAITATGTNAGLVMSSGGNYNILTPASYAGAVLNSAGMPVAQTDTSGGVYGSITLSGANATLKINGVTYTLIHSMSQLDLIDTGNSATNMYYDVLTGAYDKPIATINTTIASYKSPAGTCSSGSGTCYWDTATQLYDIPRTQTYTTNSPCGAATCYYDLNNPGQGNASYDLTAAYSGKINRYYWDPSNGTYDMANYSNSLGQYYDPSVGWVLGQSQAGQYTLTANYSGSYFYYDPATGKYDIPIYQTSSKKDWNVTSNSYNTTTSYPTYTWYYFDPSTARYDLLAPYTATGYYALAQNLDASGTTYISSLISSFSGTIAGLGHTISNLTINESPSISETTGLIGQTTGTTSVLRDIGLVNANINYPAGAAGTLVGIFNGGTISGAYSTGAVTASYGGGLARTIYSTTVSNCYSDAVVTASQGYGGGLIAAAVNSSITNSHATGTATVAGGTYTGIADPDGNAGGSIIDYAGGLVASITGLSAVSNSYATGAVNNVHGRYAGGLIGSIYQPGARSTSVTDSFATGPVTALGFVGGLIGNSTGSSSAPVIVKYDYTTGTVTAVGSGWASSGYVGYLGGLIGYATYTNVSYCFATGNVVASIPRTAGEPLGIFNTITDNLFQDVGGLVGGLTNGSISYSYATGNVSGPAAQTIGGLVGSGSNISNSYATGDVSGWQGVGGLAGGGSNITNSYSTGNVSGYQIVGGLAGSGSNITNSWESGNVNGTYEVGGLGGQLGNTSNSYSKGNVTGVDRVGGLGGDIGSRVTITGSWSSGKVNGATNTGGIAGYLEYYGNVFSNDYWNAASQSNAIGGMSARGTASSIDNKGLSGSQWNDLPIYLNGTASTVLTERADAAIAAEQQQANLESDGQQTGGQASFSGQGSNTTGQVLNNQVGSFTPSNTGTVNGAMDNHIVYSSESGGYSATIKSITADGVQFDLEGGSQGGPNK